MPLDNETKKGKPVYLDASQPVDRRVEILLDRMTLEEKTKQLNAISSISLGQPTGPGGKMFQRMTPEEKTEWGASILENGRFTQKNARRYIGKSGLGATGSLGVVIEPKQAAETANAIQKFTVENGRLGIPILFTGEGVHGYMAKGATFSPQAIGMASTWNPDLDQKIGSVVAKEARAVGCCQVFSPVLGVARDARWGRTEETFGEDPYLASCFATAMVKGLQGEEGLTNSDSIIATAKHFAAHSEPLGGRDSNVEGITERDLREIFLPPFKAAIEAGAESVMTAYSTIDSIPCTASRKLLTKILREEWGFKGHVVSDFGAVEHLRVKHRVAATLEEAVKQAVEAGLDMHFLGPRFADLLLKLVKEGRVSKATLDKAVKRILRLKFLLGLFENPYVDPERAAEICDCKEHRELALQAARESIVLLKDENNLLPLNKNIKSILITGPNANNMMNQLGSYSCESRVVTVVEGIKNKVSAEVNYAKGCDIKGTSTEGIQEAVEAAQKADVAIVVVGESGWGAEQTSGEEFDRADLLLPGVQEDLVKAIYETGTPTVVVLINGRPLAIKWIAENIPAILEAWYPGVEGGNAIADVIFGDYNPSGKLPITFPQFVGQLPLYYNYKPSGRGYDYVEMEGKPLFNFGYGISYTKFRYSNLRITPEKIAPAGEVNISVDLQNIGEREGQEVVQLYVSDDYASVARPVKELKGFRRISLKPGETKIVDFTLMADQLAFYDSSMNLVVEPGTFTVMVGGNSSEVIEGSFKIAL